MTINCMDLSGSLAEQSRCLVTTKRQRKQSTKAKTLMRVKKEGIKEV